jgi:uncharacterized membrane-anchored protein YitT (DUF2179 family)
MALEIIKQYGALIFVVAVLAIILVILIYNKRKDVLYHAALIAVTRAQETWGSDMGKVKFAEAYAYLKHEYPMLTLFISSETLTNIIKEALEELKKLIISKAEKAKKEGIQVEEMDGLTQSLLQQINGNNNTEEKEKAAE